MSPLPSTSQALMPLIPIPKDSRQQATTEQALHSSRTPSPRQLARRPYDSLCETFHSTHQITTDMLSIYNKTAPYIPLRHKVTKGLFATCAVISKKKEINQARIEAEQQIAVQKQMQLDLRQKIAEIFKKTIRVGEKLGPKGSEYTITSPINKGSHGAVVQVKNAAEQLFAAKFSFPHKKYYELQKNEEKMVRSIVQNMPNAQAHIVSLIQGFDVEILPQSEGNTLLQSRCTIYELLGMNLYEFLTKKYPQGCPLPMIRDFAKQLLETLDGLAEHQIVHGDLKPENIAFQTTPSDQNTGQTIKVIDFGLSKQPGIRGGAIQSLWYRAPEVALGNDYGPDVDMWSLACILAELYTGQALFDVPIEKNAREIPQNKDLLVKITSILGSSGLPRSANPLIENNDSIRHCRGKKNSNILGQALKTARKESTSVDDDLFIDLLQSMFKLNPAERISAKKALQLPFIQTASFLTPPALDQPALELSSASFPVAMPISNSAPALDQPSLELSSGSSPAAMPICSSPPSHEEISEKGLFRLETSPNSPISTRLRSKKPLQGSICSSTALINKTGGRKRPLTGEIKGPLNEDNMQGSGSKRQLRRKTTRKAQDQSNN